MLAACRTSDGVFRSSCCCLSYAPSRTGGWNINQVFDSQVTKYHEVAVSCLKISKTSFGFCVVGLYIGYCNAVKLSWMVP